MTGLTMLACLQWVDRQRGQWRQHDATLARAWSGAPLAAASAVLPAPRSASTGVDQPRLIVLPDARLDVTR